MSKLPDLNFKPMEPLWGLSLVCLCGGIYLDKDGLLIAGVVLAAMGAFILFITQID